MNIDRLEEKMIQACEGELTELEYNLLMKEIKANEELEGIWKSYQELYMDMAAVEEAIPSPSLRNNFQNWLEEEAVSTEMPQASSTIISMNWRRWAGIAAIFVCVFGFWRMYEHNVMVEKSLAQVSSQMENMMSQQSSTERIKAIRVNFNELDQNTDKNMIEVLIRVLHNDESSNVRLAAVETLAQHMDSELVREALIKSLSTERDGGVKFSIITHLGQFQNEDVKSVLENIVNDDSQERFVIDEAHMQLIRFDEVEI